ncbi:EAL domain-containing protein [Pseudoalteromonas shioyasakiensis]|uniref:EAL domain-containing protein n=1 Tax=Pseudoalteromonas shioyasakiensis TaxID=1190813 RepID=A0ABT6U4P3_9GAMM|nr:MULTISPECIES: EAL domain-containing protein [Pseudoalteromonas]MDI4670782.1 EAL domain-containing protein [Pseudoalteromonas shioyasakiensis]MDI4671789.1 EAL domain-containing protein [Pseudoalteromonas shioyasakiensis]MDI4687686.1 EAL domain-containing protein [Pseudoalteromonas shioyasakiensis]MDI4706287.1 EAL domain-containing protein [Pseudoalteromonas shioyasakiensis]NUJ22827.1 EAL domain-containing protein [Pseudoalteromonas sp. 0802]
MLFSHHENSHNKVLVVDDEPTSLMIMAESLSDLGEIVCCDNGAQAIEKAVFFQPDVILLDIEMPGMNGFEVCKKLKNNPKTAQSHVIFVTSHNEQIFEYQSFASGGIDLIHKPVDLNICRLRVQNQLKLKHQEAQILAAKNDISTLVAQVPVYISYWSNTEENLFSNDETSHWFSKSSEQMLGCFAKDVLPDELYEAFHRCLTKGIEQEVLNIQLASPRNKIEYVRAQVNLRIKEREVVGVILTLSDITSITHTKKLLSNESERLRVMLNSIGDAVIATDNNAIINFMNPIAERLTGWHAEEAKGRHIEEVMKLVDATSNKTLVNPISVALKEQRIVAMALNSQLTGLDGRVYRVEDSAAPIRDIEGNIIGGIIVFHDVSESIAMAVKMSHLANHDLLTDLPNRVLLHDRVTHACKVATSMKKKVALMLIDIDHFKYLNDTLGHHQGDLIIKHVAKRLESLIDLNTTLARIGGDEFVILLPDVQSTSAIDAIASDIINTMNEPFRIDSQEYILSVSVGVSVNPADSTQAEEMMTHADAAMYRAKEQGRNRFCYYSDDLEYQFKQRQSVEKLLRHAIEQDKIEVFYQPKLALLTEKIIGVEALVRLRDDENKLISPLDFIPLAEETGLIHALGQSVLKQSCIAAKEWADKGHNIKVAVNIAAKQFTDGNFCNLVADTIEQAGLASELLELEVTESALMHDFEEIKIMLSKLSDLGLTIAIDDFGTGYSSLSYLKLFPVDVLKIDQSFVRDMLTDTQSMDIVRTITSLAHTLNLQIVAEGIEEKQHLNSLIDLGCELGQGYYFHKPMPKEEFDKLLG